MADKDGFYRDLLDNLYDGIYFVDRDRRITYWNRGAERLSGYSPERAVGTHCRDNLLVHIDDTGRSLCLEGCPLAATMEDGGRREAEVFLRHRDGHRVPVLVRTEPIRDEGGRIVGGVEIFSDNSARVRDRQRIDELDRLSLMDPLTELGNRRFVEMQLATRLGELSRYGTPFAVAFMDIDRFKAVNDAHGHEAGDEALRLVGRTLANAVRAGDQVGRWGGEEFLILLASAQGEGPHAAAERFRLFIERSNLVRGGVTVPITVSLGVTVAKADDSMESLVERADRLMYRSKEGGATASPSGDAGRAAPSAPYFMGRMRTSTPGAPFSSSCTFARSVSPV